MAGYNNISQFRDIIDEVPTNNTNVWGMITSMNTEFSMDKYNVLMTDGEVYKLTYKDELHPYVNGKLTLYGHLLDITSEK